MFKTLSNLIRLNTGGLGSSYKLFCARRRLFCCSFVVLLLFPLSSCIILQRGATHFPPLFNIVCFFGSPDTHIYLSSPSFISLPFFSSSGRAFCTLFLFFLFFLFFLYVVLSTWPHCFSLSSRRKVRTEKRNKKITQINPPKSRTNA